MRGKWALIGGSAVLAAVAAGALTMWMRGRAEKPAAAKAATIDPVIVDRDISLQGRVEAREVVGVQAPSDGTIAEYLVMTGEEVFEGQLLARIRNPSLENEHERAREAADKAQEKVNALESQMIAARLEASRGQAEVARLRDDYSRTERLAQRQEMLHKEGATARLTYEKAVTEFGAARLEFETAAARLKAAQGRVAELSKDIELSKRILDEKNRDLEESDSNLQATQIHAPVDGLILERKGEAGTEIKMGEDGVFRIATDLGQLQVVVEPEASVLAKLQPGQAATVILAEFASEVFNAEINRIEGGKVFVMFGSPDPAIKPGITAQVRIRLP